jgi:hypothetical protein
MRHPAIIALLAAAAAAPSALRAQQPSDLQNDIVAAVSRCLIVGLPRDWHQAQVVIDLDAPGAASGEARYRFSRTLSRAELEPFTPCADADPAKALVEMRGLQEPERRGWKSMRFVLNREGKFDLTYDYPK